MSEQTDPARCTVGREAGAAADRAGAAMSPARILSAAETASAIRSYAEIELPERLRESLALFLRLERKVLREYDPELCELFDRLLKGYLSGDLSAKDVELAYRGDLRGRGLLI